MVWRGYINASISKLAAIPAKESTCHVTANAPVCRSIPAFLLLIALLTGCRPEAPEAETLGYSLHYEGIMGTVANFTFYADERTARELGDATMEVFEQVNQRFSTYIEDSELSRLNASAHLAPFSCSAEMWELLVLARRAYAESHGAFDISAGPLMRLWGFYRKRDSVPSQAEIEEILQRVGLDKVIFDDDARTVFFTQPEMMLDSGGIAKGYALDLAADRLRELGVTRGVIDLGGNIRVLQDPPPGRDHYSIAVRNPRRTRKTIGLVPMLDQSIATSGDYERYVMLDDKRYSHIMDPRTGYPVEGMASVTVVAPDGTLSDYLSTAIFVNRGGPYIAELLRQYPEVDVLVIKADAGGQLSKVTYGDIWSDVMEPEQW